MSQFNETVLAVIYKIYKTLKVSFLRLLSAAKSKNVIQMCTINTDVDSIWSQNESFLKINRKRFGRNWFTKLTPGRLRGLRLHCQARMPQRVCGHQVQGPKSIEVARGPLLTSPLAPRGEHSPVFRRIEGRTENFTGRVLRKRTFFLILHKILLTLCK
jgi:hypothetical protein